MPDTPKVLLIVDLLWEYSRGFLRGIARYAHLHGPWIFYSEPEKKRSRVTDLHRKQATGMIIAIEKPQDEILRQTRKMPTIVTLVRERYEALHRVIPDSTAIGEMAAGHFLDRGFTHFAYCGYHDTFWSVERGEAFETKLKKQNHDVHMFWIRRTDATYSSNPKLLDWLSELPKPVAIMATNDHMGRNLIDACRIAELDVPEQVAILGVDNDQLICDLSHPMLSSIALDTENAGYKAAALLDALMAGQKPLPRTIKVSPVYIITRQSTDILAVEDEPVAAVLRYIRRNAKRPICVADILSELKLSRRGLEVRFRRILGRSIHDQIRRVRTDLIARMLADSTVSLTKIADELGFPDPGHMNRYFKSQKGQSLMQFRKKHGPA